MNINEIYEKLLTEGMSNSGDLVKVETGLFSEEELIKVFSGYIELFFRIDKTGLFEIINEIISEISKLPKNDDFNHMIDIFNILQKIRKKPEKEKKKKRLKEIKIVNIKIMIMIMMIIAIMTKILL